MSVIQPAAKSLAAVTALQMSLPLTLGITMGLGLRSLASRPRTIAQEPLQQEEETDEPDTRRPLRVLISGAKMTKALVLARAFSAAGHLVFISESPSYPFAAHRFSEAVTQFLKLPDSESPHYPGALKRHIIHYSIDVYVPVTSPAGSLRDSELVPELEGLCAVLHAGPDVITSLDDKGAFAEAANEAGLRVPKTVTVRSAGEVLSYDFAGETRPFILKRIAYDPIGRLDLTALPMAEQANMESYVKSLGISEANPYVLQEFIVGTEYCTHGFFRSGQLRVHCCCQSSPFQVNYEHIDEPKIREWVEQFGRSLDLTGQASFDFIKADDDGEVYAIECNPRTHSAITLFANDDRLAAAYLDDEPDFALPIEPLDNAKLTYWTAHELWKLASSLRRSTDRVQAVGDVISTLAHGRDAVFDPRDPLPFLLLHHVHIPALLLRSGAQGRDWHRIDFNIGKLVQAGGD